MEFSSNRLVQTQFEWAAKGCPGITGCGGLIRDASGAWIHGFAKHIGRCTAFITELWGVLRGLDWLGTWASDLL